MRRVIVLVVHVAVALVIGFLLGQQFAEQGECVANVAAVLLETPVMVL